MKTRGSFEHMLEEVSKKPRLKELYSRIDEMTEAEIEALSVPAWIKKYWKKHGDIKKEEDRQAMALRFAAEMIAKSSPHKNPVYKTYKYNGMGDTILRHGLTLSENDLIAVINDRMIKVGSHCTKTNMNEISDILSKSTYLSDNDIYAYNELHKHNLMYRTADLVQVEAPTRDYSMQTIMAGVKFY